MQAAHRAAGRHGNGKYGQSRAIALAEQDFAPPAPQAASHARPVGERLAWPAAAAGIGVVSLALWVGLFALARLILGA